MGVCRNLSLCAILLAPSVRVWNAEQSGVKSSLRGIHHAAPGVAWASGSGGTLLRSEDAGFVWQRCPTPEAARALDFRGMWAWDADHAIAMSSGPGDASQLYSTPDGGAHWTVVFSNPDKEGFFDAIVFADRSRGVLLGDPVQGRFSVWLTSDGGLHWNRDQSSRLEALPGEGVFAASNSALAVAPGGTVYFGTGGKNGPRVFSRRPSGDWRATRVPIARGTESSGIFSLCFRDARHGVAVGGDYRHPEQGDRSAAWTADAGATWHSASPSPAGYRSGVAWDEHSKSWITVGPSGTDISLDDGHTWKPLDQIGWNAVSLPWAAGADGRIAQLDRYALQHALGSAEKAR